MSSPIEEILNNTGEDQAWTDLPVKRLLACIPDVVGDIKLLDQITAYHDIPKDDIGNIAQRCTFLMLIAGHIQSLSTSGAVSATLLDLQSTALKKRAYLQKIEKLYADGILVSGNEIYNIEKVRGYFEDFKKIPETQLVLINKVHYDSKNARFWGEYWLEVIDPCHRPLEHYKEQWLQEESVTPFFLWLEKHEVSPYHKRMSFLNNQEREENKLTIINGLVYKGGQLLTTDNRDETLLVITQDKDIISCIAGKDYRHISMTAGKPMLGGGSLKATNGSVTEIHSDSGHYLPDEDVGYQMLAILKAKGLQLPDTLPFFYFKNFNEIKTTVGAFMREHSPSSNNSKKPPTPKL